ncbi:MAG: ATP-binding protein [Gammaproteobacteria bacterium]|nr:ATP-binding protein [Gammaproteobacteria bacterium]
MSQTRQNRKELIISIPVITENIREFTFQKGEYNVKNVTHTIFNFVNDSVSSFGFDKAEYFKVYFGELIKNSYDAYAQSCLKKDSYLVLKIVVSLNESRELIIKIKDNGPGFQNQSKSVFFQPKRADYMKKGDDYLGGRRIGLEQFINCVNYLDGNVNLKNRKEKGCAVYCMFKLPNTNSESDNLEYENTNISSAKPHTR